MAPVLVKFSSRPATCELADQKFDTKLHLHQFLTPCFSLQKQCYILAQNAAQRVIALHEMPPLVNGSLPLARLEVCSLRPLTKLSAPVSGRAFESTIANSGDTNTTPSTGASAETTFNRDTDVESRRARPIRTKKALRTFDWLMNRSTDKQQKMVRTMFWQGEKWGSKGNVTHPTYVGGLFEEPGRDQPFRNNPWFKSQPVLSEYVRNLIYDKVTQKGETLKAVSVELGVDVRRVAAVVRMKEVELQWKAEVSFIS